MVTRWGFQKGFLTDYQKENQKGYPMVKQTVCLHLVSQKDCH